VVRILPSEAQDVGKEEDRGAGVRAWDMGYGLLLARYPVFWLSIGSKRMFATVSS
jgi:hypothetical protein